MDKCSHHERFEDHIKDGDKFREKVLRNEIEMEHISGSMAKLEASIIRMFDKLDEMKNSVDDSVTEMKDDVNKSIRGMLMKVFSGTFVFNAVAVGLIFWIVRVMISSIPTVG